MNNQLTETDVALLKQAAEATNVNSVMYAQPLQMANLAAAQLVEGNPQLIDPATQGIAYRATVTGLTYVQNLVAAASAPAVPAAPAAPAPVAAAPVAPAVPAAPVAASGGFQTGSGFQPPAKASRRPLNNGRSYPFESLEMGGYIFVPATEKRPDPKKSLASTISSANKRFEGFNPRRYFRTFRATAGQVFGSVAAPSDGAYIVRVEPPVDDVQG